MEIPFGCFLIFILKEHHAFTTCMLLHWIDCVFWTKRESDFRAPRAEVSLSYLYISSVLSMASVLGAWFLIFTGTLSTWEMVEEIWNHFSSNPCKRSIHTLKQSCHSSSYVLETCLVLPLRYSCSSYVDWDHYVNRFRKDNYALPVFWPEYLPVLLM